MTPAVVPTLSQIHNHTPENVALLGEGWYTVFSMSVFPSTFQGLCLNNLYNFFKYIFDQICTTPQPIDHVCFVGKRCTRHVTGILKMCIVH